MQTEAYLWQGGESDSHDYLFPAVAQLLPPDSRILIDVGCGNGAMTRRFSQLGYRVFGIDQSVDGIAVATKQFGEIPFRLLSVYEDYRQIVPQADIVVSCEVIEHLTNPRAMLRRAFEVLRPGGTMVLTTPYHGYLKNLALSLTNKWDNHFQVDREHGHIKFFSQTSLVSLLKAEGFEDFHFNNAGRVWGLWKSLVVKATKPT